MPGWPAPIYVQPAQGFPQQQFAPQTQVRPPQQQWVPPPPPNVLPSGRTLAGAQTPAAPREPIARGKFDDIPAPAATPAWSKPTPVTLPSPEQLGVACTAAAPRTAVTPETADWNATHTRLRQLGALGWQVARLPQGGYRFTFLLPTAQPNCSRHVEATGASEAEAVRLALASVEPQAGAGR
jgi:hypothetical protein